MKKMAVNTLGDALAAGGTTFSSDDDPELVRAAVPFSLKLIESLLAESPQHEGLLLAAARGYTQYTYAFVQQEADEIEGEDLTRAMKMRKRARRLYLRARNYGLRGLEVKHRGFGESLLKNSREAVLVAEVADVSLLYWTAVSWAGAISVSKNEPELIVDMVQVEALIDRALELDEAFDNGAIHTFLITYEMVRPGGQGEPAQRARSHFRRAVELSDGQMAGPFVSMAEAVAVQQQNLLEFKALLDRALAIDPDVRPEWRLANRIMQRRAQWLLGRTDELFLVSDSQ
jgi:predicted anti-sigma-YlaC factor YlaD